EYKTLVRILEESSSFPSRPVHRTRQKIARNYTSDPVIAIKTTVKKEEPSDRDEISPLLYPTSQIYDISDWQHPAELEYLDAVDWSKAEVVKFLITHSFSTESTTVIPTSYRIPLMFVANFQLTSLQLVLSVDTDIRKTELNKFKGGILHISRLCDTLLGASQRAMDTFDRALVRYRMEWLLSDPGKVQEFWDLYGKEEYEKDPVKLGMS
ncbi:uncharacterized protein EV420DRAFT_1566663, partial [Desarmillaria tabescens]